MKATSRPLSPLLIALMAASCADVPTGTGAPPDGIRTSIISAELDEGTSRIVVDAGTALGPVMRFERGDDPLDVEPAAL